MSFPQFKDIKLLSNTEISEKIIQVEKELFDLKFKKATRQPFKPHEILYAKRVLAQLKTLLSQRLDKLEKSNKRSISSLIEKKDYLNANF